MASIVKRPNGTREIAVVVNGKRPVIRLGHCTAKAAETAKVRIEELAGIVMAGGTPTNATLEWLNGRDEVLLARLERAGLIGPQRKAVEVPTLAAWIETYLSLRRDIKRGTMTNFLQVRDLLLEHFPADKPLDSFTTGDAEDFGLWLRTERSEDESPELKHRKRRLAEGTVRRHMKRCKQFFAAAVKRGIITANPFEGIKTSDFAPNRFYFVTQQEAATIMDACPDIEWRLIFALARYGGLRIPSELANLEWDDLNFERARFIVKSPKTEHHDGKGMRVVPIFPELMPLFLEAFEQAKPGERYIIRRHRDSNANLGTQMRRIIKRAGLKPWDKLFTNMRSTRLTELSETFPVHVVTSWLGNSPVVAAKHYLQVTADHFDRAAEGGKPAAESAAHPQQNPHQQAAAEKSTGLQDAPDGEHKPAETLELCSAAQSGAASCSPMHYNTNDPIGI